MNESSSAPLTVRSSTRPIRVAYLFDPTDITNDDVDAVVRFCTSSWGGRYCAFIPVVDGDIAIEWRKFLGALDPDFVYPLCEIPDSLFVRICRMVPPCRFFDFIPDCVDKTANIRQIPMADTRNIPRYLWSQRKFIQKPSFRLVHASEPTVGPYRFALRNFGVLREGTETGEMFMELQVSVVDVAKSQWTDLLEHPGPATIAGRFDPIDLAEALTPKQFELGSEEPFELVIGDSPLDGIHAWNAIFAANSNLGKRTSAWLHSTALEDASHLKAVAA